MANTLRFKRGLVAGIPTGVAGEPLFTTDTFDLYIGNGTTNTRFQKYIASGTTSQLLRGDGSLLTMPIVLTSPSNGQVLKYNGTSWVNDSDAGITGSGSAGQVAYFTGATTQSGSNNLFWDSANSRLGIGSNVPTQRLDVSGYIRATSGFVGNSGLQLWADNSSLAAGARLTTGGNFIINNPSVDNGLRFQVTGDGFFSGSVGVGTSTLAGKLTILNGSNFTPTATSSIGGTASQRLHILGGEAGLMLSSDVNPSTGVQSGTQAYQLGLQIGFYGVNDIRNQIYYGNAPLTFVYSSNQGTSVTERMRLDASGNLGLGVTPSAWAGVANVLQVGTGGVTSSFFNSGTDGMHLASNAFFDTSTYKYVINGTATIFRSAQGQFRWLQAPSGTTGAAITFTQAMTLTANGRLLLGTTGEQTYRLAVAGDVKFDADAATNGFYWDNTNKRLGIGTNAPSGKIEIAGTSNLRFFSATDITADVSMGFISANSRNTGVDELAKIDFRKGSIYYSGEIAFSTANDMAVGALTERMRISRTGSVGIGTTSLTGFNLRIAKNITGGAIQKIVNQDGTVQSDVTNLAFGFLNSARTAAASFTLPNYHHFYAEQYALGAGSSITNQFGFVADNTLTGATNNYGFYGNISSGTGRWNLYMNGTAANYLAGELYVGGTSAYGATITSYGSATRSGGLGIRNSAGTAAGGFFTYAAGSGSGSTDIVVEATGFMLFNAGGSERMKLYSATGNFAIGSTASDSTQRLQVTGDTLLKGSGNTSATTALTVQNSDGNNILRLRNDLAALFNFVGTSLTMSGESNYTIMSANQAFYFRSNGGTAGRAFKIFDNAISLTGTTGANQNIQSLITFAPTSGTATYTDLDLFSTINQTGGANGITRGVYVRPTLTAAADWRSIEWSNNTGWGLYGAGTADNFISGNTQIGTGAFTSEKLQVNGTMKVTGASTFSSAATFNGASASRIITLNAPTDGGYMTIETGGTPYVDLGSNKAIYGTGNATDFLINTRIGYSLSLGTSNVARLTIASTGAATFSSSVTAGGAITFASNVWNTSGGHNRFYFDNTNTYFGSPNLWVFQNTSGSNVVAISSAGAGTFASTLAATSFTPTSATVPANGMYLGAANQLNFSTDSSSRFSLSSTGAATFSSTLTTGGNILIGVTAGSIGSMNFIKTGTSPVASRLTFGTDGTGYSFAIGKNQAGTVTDLFSIFDSGAANFTTSIQAGTAIAIGTTPDTNKPFKILKNINATVGINFENTSTSSLAFSAIQMGTDVAGGTKFTNLVYASSGVTANGVYNPDGTSLINNGGGGLNFLGTPTRFYTGGSNGIVRLYLDNNGLTQLNATTPTTSETDGYRQYSADVVAGNAAPHFRTENGAVIKLYQETTAVGNSTISVGGGSAVLDDTQFGGYTLRQVVKALQNQGILA